MIQQYQESELSHKLRLHSIFANKLPFLLETVWDRWTEDNDTLNEHDLSKLLDAFNTHSIGTQELYNGSMTYLPQKLRTLIMVSQGLMQFICPTLSYSRPLIQNEPLLDDIPWMNQPWDFAFVPWFTYLYEYIFDHHHKELGLPSLDIIHDLRTEFGGTNMHNHNKRLLECIMDKYGFIPWSRRSIKEFRDAYYDLMDMIDKDVVDYIDDFAGFISKQIVSQTDVNKIM